MKTDPTSLENLHDIIAPPPAPWWPPAPGWYWLFALIAFLLGALFIYMLLKRQHNRYRREALAELSHHQAALANPKTRAAAVANLAALLKRCALSAFPRETVASLTGKPWHTLLDRSAGTNHFTNSTSPLLESVTFNPAAANTLTDSQIRDLARDIRHWITHHRAANVQTEAAA